MRTNALSPTRTSEITEASDSDSPVEREARAAGSKRLAFGHALPGSKAERAGGSSSSVAPRSALKTLAVRQNALARLMHAERATDLTRDFLAGHGAKAADKKVTFAPRARIEGEIGEANRVATKLQSTHNVVHHGPEEKVAAHRREDGEAKALARDLAHLVGAHPAGTFDANLLEGVLPAAMREEVAWIDGEERVDDAEVILAFQDQQRVTHQMLLNDIGRSLAQLGATSAESAHALLREIIDGAYVRQAEHEDSDELFGEGDVRPEDRVRTAYAKLPERLRGDDIIEAFESVGQPHPRQVMNAKGQAYLDTIDSRLAQINGADARTRRPPVRALAPSTWRAPSWARPLAAAWRGLRTRR